MEPEKEYVIFSKKKSDLVAMGISHEQIEQLRDEDIEKIIAEIRELYLKADIKGAIEFFVKMYLVFEMQ